MIVREGGREREGEGEKERERERVCVRERARENERDVMSMWYVYECSVTLKCF